MKLYEILLIQIKLRSSIYRQRRGDGGNCSGGKTGEFSVQHVFKEINLHNIWQVIGRIGHGGKGE